MDLWFDGFSVLANHAQTTFMVLLVIMWGFLITRGFLHHIPISEFERLALSASGWVIPVLFLSIFTFAFSLVFNAVAGSIIAILFILASSFVFIQQKINPPTLILFLVLLMISLVLRLAFIVDLVLPSYFDPAEHYRLIGLMTKVFTTGTLPDELTKIFYHLGFHAVISSISFFLQINVISLMLVFGQVGLALLSFPLFFIAKRETGSVPAAALTCLLFGFGFHMPAHLMNWGKYPALLGFITMLFVLSLVYMLYRSDLFPKRRIIFILLGVAILASILIHSRTFILYVLIGVTAFITFGWKHLKSSYRIAAFFMTILAAVLLILVIQNNAAIKTLLDSYLRNDLWILMLILLLTFMAMIRYTLQTFFLLTWLVLCLLCLFIPVNLPVIGIQTLLDRPFVQMFIVIPFSLLGGLGLVSLTQLTQRLFPDFQLTQRFVQVLIFGFLFINIALSSMFHPSDCCRFATHDDLAAFTWMGESLPEDASILIASSNFFVTSLETTQSLVGVDAGIWIPQLISRQAKFARTETLFELAKVHADLCTQGIDYIYVGGMPQSFEAAQLNSQPLWYFPVFSLPHAKVYQLTGCQE